MRAKALAALIGQVGLLEVRGSGTLAVEVEITDARHSFGRLRVEVRPTSGGGSSWVEFDRITIPSEGLAGSEAR